MIIIITLSPEVKSGFCPSQLEAQKYTSNKSPKSNNVFKPHFPLLPHKFEIPLNPTIYKHFSKQVYKLFFFFFKITTLQTLIYNWLNGPSTMKFLVPLLIISVGAIIEIEILFGQPKFFLSKLVY